MLNLLKNTLCCLLYSRTEGGSNAPITTEEEENTEVSTSRRAMAPLRVLELYSGIGGMHYALQGKQSYKTARTVETDLKHHVKRSEAMSVL